MKKVFLLLALLFSIPLAHSTIAVAEQEATVDASNVRQNVAEILARPEFARWNPEPVEVVQRGSEDEGLSKMIWAALTSIGSSIQKIWDTVTEPIFRALKAVWNAIKGLFPNSPAVSPANLNSIAPSFDFSFWLRVVGWVVLVSAVIVLAVLLVARFKHAKVPSKSGRRLTREQVHAALETGDALALEGQDWVEHADRLLAEKDVRSVYRALYLAMLAGLHSTGKIDFRQSRTNWTYVRRFKGPEAERGLFGELTGLFDEVWYGQQAGRIEDVSRVKAQVVSLVGAAALAGAEGLTDGGKRA